MTIFDYTVFSIILVSIGLGWWRGFVYELLSIAGWLMAYFVARMFAGEFAPHIPEAIAVGAAKTALAYAVLFIGTLMLSAVAGWFASKVVRFVGLGWVNRTLGAGFGLFRGVLVVIILILIAGLTPLPQKTFWQQAWSSKHWQAFAVSGKAFLPETLANRINF